MSRPHEGLHALVRVQDGVCAAAPHQGRIPSPCTRARRAVTGLLRWARHTPVSRQPCRPHAVETSCPELLFSDVGM